MCSSTIIYISSDIRNWTRLRATIEFLGIWEKLNNNNFNLTEFDQIKNASGSNAFVMTATKWVKEANAIGIKQSRGKYSEGTFAHRDIALEFASWINWFHYINQANLIFLSTYNIF